MLSAGAGFWGVAGNRTVGNFIDRTERGFVPSVRLEVDTGGVTVHIREVEGSSPFSPTKIISPRAVCQIYSGKTALGVSGAGIIIGRGSTQNRTDVGS